MMNSGEYGSGDGVVSAMADVTLDDGPQEDMKNGTAAHMRPGDGPGKGQYEDAAFPSSANAHHFYSCHFSLVNSIPMIPLKSVSSFFNLRNNS